MAALNPIHAGRDQVLDVFEVELGRRGPRQSEDDAAEPHKPRPDAAPPRGPWAWLAYEPAAPRELPFEASLGDIVRHAARHPGAHGRAVASIHVSIVAWCGLWDLCTYCGLARLWTDDAARNGGLVAAGGALLVGLDVFHGNGLAPGDVGGRVSAFWDERAGDVRWRWPRALLSFAGQVLFTCGMYNILDGDGVVRRTFSRDVAYAVLGLAFTAAVDGVLAFSEAAARQRRRPPAPGRWDLSFGGETQKPRLALALASLSYCGQVLVWVGFDNCICAWPYGDVGKCPGPCVFASRRWYHELGPMAVGACTMAATGSLLHFGFVVDRLDKAQFPHVFAWLPAPAGPPRWRSAAAASVRSFFAQAGYYAHLSAFWYLVDEDLATAGVTPAPASEARNAAYVVAGLAGLYATGCFWSDTGG